MSEPEMNEKTLRALNLMIDAINWDRLIGPTYVYEDDLAEREKALSKLREIDLAPEELAMICREYPEIIHELQQVGPNLGYKLLWELKINKETRVGVGKLQSSLTGAAG